MPSGNIHRRFAARGIVLLDAMIAIVLFSIGILGMLAMQAGATKLAGDAKYRADAAMHADQLIAQMWSSAGNPALLTQFVSPAGTSYIAWAKTLNCADPSASATCLPGVTTTANLPVVTVDNANANMVTITISWQPPNGTGLHNYVSVTQITN
jgi:type IV pilus assembly protein PilV